MPPTNVIWKKWLNDIQNGFKTFNSRKRHDVTNMAPSEKPEVIQMLDYGVNRSLVTITDNGWSQK